MVKYTKTVNENKSYVLESKNTHLKLNSWSIIKIDWKTLFFNNKLIMRPIKCFARPAVRKQIQFKSRTSDISWHIYQLHRIIRKHTHKCQMTCSVQILFIFNKIILTIFWENKCFDDSTGSIKYYIIYSAIWWSCHTLKK